MERGAPPTADTHSVSVSMSSSASAAVRTSELFKIGVASALWQQKVSWKGTLRRNKTISASQRGANFKPKI